MVECFDGDKMRRSHTNVTISSRFDSRAQLMDRVEELEFKLKQAEQKINGLHSELENIPNAVIEWGYVDICWDGKKIKLVESKVEQSQ